MLGSSIKYGGLASVGLLGTSNSLSPLNSATIGLHGEYLRIFIYNTYTHTSLNVDSQRVKLGKFFLNISARAYLYENWK